MIRILLFTVSLILVNQVSNMEQTIKLEQLLTFQINQNPNEIANYFRNSNEWVCNSNDFSNLKNTYKWFRANNDEEFESYTKDQFWYFPSGEFDAAIVFLTENKNEFDLINAQIVSLDMEVIETINKPNMINYTVYANPDQIIQVYEPLIPNNYGRYNYTFMVFSKRDYNNGFRIK